MEPNPKALQQWADAVFRHDYWGHVVGKTKMELVHRLLQAQSLSDIETVQLNANKLLVLNDVTNMLAGEAVDTTFERDFHEVLEDNAI